MSRAARAARTACSCRRSARRSSCGPAGASTGGRRASASRRGDTAALVPNSAATLTAYTARRKPSARGPGLEHQADPGDQRHRERPLMEHPAQSRLEQLKVAPGITPWHCDPAAGRLASCASSACLRLLRSVRPLACAPPFFACFSDPALAELAALGRASQTSSSSCRSRPCLSLRSRGPLPASTARRAAGDLASRAPRPERSSAGARHRGRRSEVAR